ncbi:MAG: endonuclease/exonuclease/phosphatase family protein [Paracoccus sp. (in: a-proteobacteria)]
MPAVFALACGLWAGTAPAGPLRIATFSPDLSRDGPGLLLRDLGREDAQIAAVIQVIARTRPDILLLTGLDWDHEGLALAALRQRLEQAAIPYDHAFAGPPNAGMPSGLDLDGDGRLGKARDRQGFGRFPGQGGMALLSRFPLAEIRDHSAFLWRDLPGHLMPPTPPEAAAIQRLSSVAHWDVTITAGTRPLHLLAMAATPPVFDGPEDRNGRRNHDELAFWLRHLPDAAFVLAGDLNLDPADGDGRPQALARLMDHVQDPRPASEGARQAGSLGVNAGHRGDPALDTADWPDDRPPGNMRVDYLLPRKDLAVLGAGVFWPAEEPLATLARTASRHRLVWLDLDWPGLPDQEAGDAAD